ATLAERALVAAGGDAGVGGDVGGRGWRRHGGLVPPGPAPVPRPHAGEPHRHLPRIGPRALPAIDLLLLVGRLPLLVFLFVHVPAATAVASLLPVGVDALLPHVVDADVAHVRVSAAPLVGALVQHDGHAATVEDVVIGRQPPAHP